VFLWVLGMLAEEGLLKGNTVSVDGTTPEANAALRSIVRRDTRGHLLGSWRGQLPRAQSFFGALGVSGP